MLKTRELMRKGIRRGLVGIGAIVLLYFVFAISVGTPPGHDEDQFVVPGIVTWKTGAMPWEDYPLFHTPYLVLLNGALALTTDQPFLVLRTVGALAVWLNLLLVGWMVWRLASNFGDWSRVGLACSLVALPVFSTLGNEAMFLVWNHQVPTLLATMAVAACWLAMDSARPGRWLFAAGACIGLATGMRITFLLFLAPLGLASLFLIGGSWRHRAIRGALFGAGAALVLAPLGWLAAQSVDAFVFSNFKYPKLSLMWRKYPFWKSETGLSVDAERGYFAVRKGDFQGRPFEKKLGRLENEVWRGNQVLLLSLALGGVGSIWVFWRKPEARKKLGLVWAILIFSLWGALAPSRVNIQYWFTPMVFGLLTAGVGLSISRRFGLSLVALALSISLWHWDFYECVKLVGQTGWAPNVLNRQLEQLREVLPEGRVLTLQAWKVQMAGREIYPEFALGEFSWRSSHLIPRVDRDRFHLVSAFDLDELLAERPPNAVLLETAESNLNGPILDWVRRHGFRLQRLSARTEMWVPPEQLEPALVRAE